jgi:hypothetical protein
MQATAERAGRGTGSGFENKALFIISVYAKLYLQAALLPRKKEVTNAHTN